MKNEKLAISWNNFREKLSKVDLKIYLYALGAIAVIVLIIITSNNYSKYGSIQKDGKYYLDIQKIAADYGIDLNPITTNAIDYANNEDANVTEDLSRSLYLTNLYLEQNGMTDSTARGQILADIVFAYQEQVIGNKYTLGNLNIIREENKESLQEYYEDIYNAFDKYGKELGSIPTNPFAKYQNTDSIDENTFDLAWKEMIDNIQKNINANNNLINNLISIPATENGATHQLELINIISKQTAYYKSLQQINTDPVKYLLLSGKDFMENFQNELTSTVNSLYIYFSSFGVKLNN
ncbi:MAG TPA: hypothetical protein PLE26_00870 [Candidatus Paceibacterota bacterium]|nr:hypothetical protein [Candidatus Paceibacterota bacterium]HQB56894.1 hypothetical protein [Candidatus Paceibacterota bacterium]